jgi:hypothetical protein
MTITKEKRDEIIRALEVNPNAYAVAKKIGGISHPGVWNIAKKAGIELTASNRGRNRQSPERRAEIIRALEAEADAHAVARKIGGISPVGVWLIAKKAGIDLTVGKVRRRGNGPVLSPERRTEIVRALEVNPNAMAVAQQIGDVSAATVWRIAKKIGITLQRGRPNNQRIVSPRSRPGSPGVA